MRRKIENLLIGGKELDKWIGCYAKGLPVSIAGVDFTIKDLGKSNDLIGGYIATVESNDNYPCCFSNEADMATKIIKSHDPILSVETKHLNHRGRRAKEQAEMEADRRQWSDLADKQQESREAVSHPGTHDMGFNEAIRAVLVDGKKIRRRGWFGKLLFRNPGDMTDGGFFPTIMALKLVLNWRDVAEIKTCDAGSQVNAEDKKAHDWEVVECTLPWEE